MHFNFTRAVSETSQQESAGTLLIAAWGRCCSGAAAQEKWEVSCIRCMVSGSLLFEEQRRCRYNGRLCTSNNNVSGRRPWLLLVWIPSDLSRLRTQIKITGLKKTKVKRSRRGAGVDQWTWTGLWILPLGYYWSCLYPAADVTQSRSLRGKWMCVIP